MRALIIVLLAGALAALGGCHLRHSERRDDCAPTAAYNRARIAPGVHAAEGLPAPNTRNALKIPDDVAAVRPHKSGTACLDTPPSFYADKPKPPAAK